MRRLTPCTAVALVVAGLLALCACREAPDKSPQTSAAVDQKDTARADAMRSIEGLEAAVEEARRRVASAEAASAPTTREQRAALSDTRRAIVVANVALQKARTAFTSGDFAAARAATAGVADRLKAPSQTKPADSPSPAPSPHR